MRASTSVAYAIAALAALAIVGACDAQAADESIVVVLKSFPSLPCYPRHWLKEQRRA